MKDYIFPLYTITGLGLVVGVFIISYASFKYRLMDIAEMFRRYIVFSLVSSLFVIISISIISTFANRKVLFYSTVVILLIVFFINPMQMFLQKLTNQFFVKHRYDYQGTIKNISNKLVTVLDYDKLLELIRDNIAPTMKASSFSLLLYNYDSDEYEPVITLGSAERSGRKFTSTHPSIQIIKLANREIFKEELMSDKQISGNDEFLSIFNDFNAFLVIPMRYKKVLRGIMCFGDKESGEIYTYRDIELLQILANQAIIALDNARLYELAITDELTDLYIVRFFNHRIIDEIISSIRLKRSLSLLMIDLDHFKLVNDNYGHQTGDIVLKRVAAIVKEQVRAIDLVTRYGGEEFAVILPETDNAMAESIAERIRENVELYKFDKDLKLTVSVGISTISGYKISPTLEVSQNLTSIERKNLFDEIKATFIFHADEALYVAKRKGRNRCVNNGVLSL